MKVLSIIPARGGSKGIPRKNVRLVGGKPLIEWTFFEAIRSNYCEHLFVSTDDDEIASVAKLQGVDVVMRPAEFARDKSPMIEAVAHMLDTVERSINDRFDYILLLQPTAPLRIAEDINGGMQTLIESNADSVISVYRVEDVHPSRMYTIEDGRLLTFAPEPEGSLRQDLPNVYHRNGAIYACTRSFFKESGKLWGGGMVPYIMPKDRSANIDAPIDLEIADFLLRRRKK